KSLDERRRRRLAADESKQRPKGLPAEVERPLPERRPTGRFPLRRIIARSPWKLAAVGFASLVLACLAVGAGQFPQVRAGEFGPGFRDFCAAETGRLTTAVAGLLLLASGQLAWLIRWARAR